MFEPEKYPKIENGEYVFPVWKDRHVAVTFAELGISCECEGCKNGNLIIGINGIFPSQDSEYEEMNRRYIITPDSATWETQGDLELRCDFGCFAYIIKRMVLYALSATEGGK